MTGGINDESWQCYKDKEEFWKIWRVLEKMGGIGGGGFFYDFDFFARERTFFQSFRFKDFIKKASSYYNEFQLFLLLYIISQRQYSFHMVKKT